MNFKTGGLSLGYDESTRKDVRLTYYEYPSGGGYVELYEEPDKPFQKGYLKQTIHDLSTIINGKPLTELISEAKAKTKVEDS